MVRFLAGRIAGGAVTLLILVVVVHGLTALTPGDPLAAVLGPSIRHLPADEIARLRSDMGLDRPWPVRLALYLGGLARGDLGTSWRSGRSVAREVGDRLPFTLALTAAALPLAIGIGLVVGVAAAAAARTALDTALTGALVVGSAVPVYWTGLLLLLAFALAWNVLPSGGAGGAAHLVLPTATLALASAAPFARLARASLLEALAAPHVVAARARGLSRAAVLRRHALRNALVPVVTLAGLDLGRMLGGVVFVEAVFAWPGLGRLIVDAIVARDLPLVQGAALAGAAAVILANLAVDLLLWALDPRTRPA